MTEAKIKPEPVVYVVDDDPQACRAVAELVHTFGHQVRLFESSNEFLENVDDSRPGCVVLDLRLPGLDGMEVHQRLLQRGIALPVVGLIGATGSVMLTFFAASYVQVFQPLEGPSQPSARQESPSSDVVPWLLPALAGACAAVVLGAVVGGSMEGMGSETATPSKEQGLGASIRSRMPNGGGDGAKPAKDPTAQAQAKPSSATGSAAVAS